MTVRSKIKCPYCKILCNLVRDIADNTTRTLYTCCEDRGGCGLDFVVDIIVQPKIEIRKIEGEA